MAQNDTAEGESDDEKLYEVRVELSYVERTDIEASSPEEAEERLAFFVRDDISQGIIDVNSFELKTDSRKVSDDV